MFYRARDLGAYLLTKQTIRCSIDLTAKRSRLSSLGLDDQAIAVRLLTMTTTIKIPRPVLPTI